MESQLTHLFACLLNDKLNIFSLRKEIRNLGWNISEKDFDQAVSFLHDNGILLNYDDNSSLSDLYFVDPQWLCTNLANVITVKNVNCDIINGE